MRLLFRIFFAIFLVIYSLINFYIGNHGRQFFRSLGIPLASWIYWLFFWLLAFSYILSRGLTGRVPDLIYRPLHILGAFWLAAMVYFLLILLSVDTLRLANRFFSFLPSWTASLRFRQVLGILIILSVDLLLTLGFGIARNPKITPYDVPITKEIPGREELRVVLASDIHLGSLVRGPQLERLVKKINSLEPDLILLAGDTLDEDLGVFLQEGMDADLGKLRAPLGVYAVPGNHEYLGGGLEEFSQHLRFAGIQMLRDRTVQVEDILYITGRDDRIAPRFTGKKRQDLSALTTGLDPTLPLIVMDHQPYDLAEALAVGADLQVSGHTHRGQIWPGHLITRRIYEIDYGLLKKGSTTIVVSSGYGTWGPPVRIGTRPEIVLIRLIGANSSSKESKKSDF